MISKVMALIEAWRACLVSDQQFRDQLVTIVMDYLENNNG